MTVERLVAAYLEQREKDGVSACTLELTSNWLARFLGFCRERKLEAILGLTPWHLEEFQNALLWAPSRLGRFYSPNSVYQALAMVRACLRWGMSQGWLVQDPTSDLVLSHPVQPRQRVLTRDELTCLLEAPSAKTAVGLRDRALLALIYFLPVSSAEATALNVADMRSLPGAAGQALDSRLAARLDRYLYGARPELASGGDEPALFLTTGGKRLGRTLPLALCSQWGKAAGLGPGVCPRVLRRSFQQHLAEFTERRLPRLESSC